MASEHAPPYVDTTRPSPARIYDLSIGGDQHYAIDRQTSAQISRAFPDAPVSAVENRRLLVRVVAELAGRGIRQFLDLGSGLPTQENVHQVAQRIAPDARVVYVDNDPMTHAHAHALLGDQQGVGYLDADLRDHESILNDPRTRALIRRDEPVALLMIAVLHFIPDADLPALLRAYIDALPSGSYVAISHASTTGMPADLLERIHATYDNAPSPLFPRPAEQIRAMFDGLELLPPGLVSIVDWPAPQGRTLTLPLFCGVAVKP
ncbi:SAM-dependent methyltransferase [Actinomadura rupiterrae]|uniref:SAM-dependent methyltransferase n=1 Tax=Actinomadura rupiterrae TaxID=559627 RepID=UPI0020A3FFE3|nr:SAM-dependent methyltransferase [Actinomadura rupiterrae]MCP2338925.1 hypothetical protein [Actinomadura rupiterrae]